ALGAAVSLNRVQNEVRAWIDGAGTSVEAPVVTVRADSNADVEAYVVSGVMATGSGGATSAFSGALGGSVSVNWPASTVEAGVADGAVTAQSAESLIAANRSGNTLTADVTFSVVYDGRAIPVTVTRGNFTTAARLRAHIQSAVGQALVAAGAGRAGDVAVTLGAGNGILLAHGHTLHPSAPQSALAAAPPRRRRP